MISIQIEQLTEESYGDAVAIAVATGEEAEVAERLRHYKHYYVAKIEDRVVGEIGWYLDDGSWARAALASNFPNRDRVYWISHFAVVKHFRGMGIGTQLIRHLEQVISKMNGNELWVYSERARGFYERNGFVFVQRGYVEECWQDFLYKLISPNLD